MANGIGEFVYETDKALFYWLQDTLLAQWMGSWGVYLGNIYFWTPVFIFLLLLMILNRPHRGSWNVFFALGVVVVTYQASVILSGFISHPPPYYFYALEGIRLPAFQVEATYSLPDWPMAAFYALFSLIRIRMKSQRNRMPVYFWLAPVLFFLFRLLAGFAFPVDLLTSVILGAFIAFLMARLADGVDVLLDGESR